MGNCNSSDVITTGRATAKVIFPNGHLEEYAGGHVRASQVLHNGVSEDPSSSSSRFLCKADDMEFEGYVSAVDNDSLLRQGQIYFVLPVSILRKRLRTEDMAALAVMASSVLVKSGASVVVDEGDIELQKEKVGKRSEEEEKRRGKRRSKSSGRGRDFIPELGVILE